MLQERQTEPICLLFILIYYNQRFQLFPQIQLWGKGETILILPNNTLLAKNTYIISVLFDLKYIL